MRRFRSDGRRFARQHSQAGPQHNRRWKWNLPVEELLVLVSFADHNERHTQSGRAVLIDQTPRSRLRHHFDPGEIFRLPHETAVSGGNAHLSGSRDDSQTRGGVETPKGLSRGHQMRQTSVIQLPGRLVLRFRRGAGRLEEVPTERDRFKVQINTGGRLALLRRQSRLQRVRGQCDPQGWVGQCHFRSSARPVCHNDHLIDAAARGTKQRIAQPDLSVSRRRCGRRQHFGQQRPIVSVVRNRHPGQRNQITAAGNKQGQPHQGRLRSQIEPRQPVPTLVIAVASHGRFNSRAVLRGVPTCDAKRQHLRLKHRRKPHCNCVA